MANLSLSTGLLGGLMNPAYTDKLGDAITQGMLVPGAAKQQFRQTKGLEAQQRLLNSGMTDQATIEAMTKIGEDWGVNPETTNQMIQQAKANAYRAEQEKRAAEHAKLAKDNARLAKLRYEKEAEQVEKNKQIEAGINRSYQGWKNEAERDAYLATLDPEVANAIRKHEESATTREYNQMLIDKAKDKGRPWSDAELAALGEDPEIKIMVEEYKRQREAAPAGKMENHNARFEAQLEYVQRQRAKDVAMRTPTETEIEQMGEFIGGMEQDTPIYDSLTPEQQYYVNSHYASQMKSGALPSIMTADAIERYSKLFLDADPREQTKLQWLKETIGSWFMGDQPSAPAPTGPQPGDEKDGYIFQGGDPSKPENWKRK